MDARGGTCQSDVALGIRKTRTASAYGDLRQMEAWGASFGEVRGDVDSAIAFRLERHPFIRSSAGSISKNKREIDFWLHWTLAFTEHGRAHCSTSCEAHLADPGVVPHGIRVDIRCAICRSHSALA